MLLTRNIINQHDQSDNNQQKIHDGNDENMDTIRPLKISFSLLRRPDTQMTT